MNFDLKKYLMLSIIGLAFCNTQSDAANYSQYNNWQNGPFNNQGTSSVIPVSKKIVVKNAYGTGIVDTTVVDANFGLQTMWKFMYDQLINDANYSAASAMLSCDNINYMERAVQQWVFESESEVSNVQQISNSSQYIYDPKLKNNVIRIISLANMVGKLKKFVSANQVKFTLGKEREDSVLGVLWNMLISISAERYESFYNNLRGCVAMCLQTGDFTSDCALGAVLECIMNKQRLYKSGPEFMRANLMLESCFKVKQQGKQEVFTILPQGKVQCKISSWIKTSNMWCSPEILEKYKFDNLNFNETFATLEKIGFDGILSQSEIIALTMLLQDIDLGDNVLGPDANKFNNGGDVILWINDLLNKGIIKAKSQKGSSSGNAGQEGYEENNDDNQQQTPNLHTNPNHPIIPPTGESGNNPDNLTVPPEVNYVFDGHFNKGNLKHHVKAVSIKSIKGDLKNEQVKITLHADQLEQLYEFINKGGTGKVAINLKSTSVGKQLTNINDKKKQKMCSVLLKAQSSRKNLPLIDGYDYLIIELEKAN